MKNNKNSLKNSIERAMKTPLPNREQDSRPADQHPALEAEVNEQPRKEKFPKEYKFFGAVCIAISLLLIIFSDSSTVDSSQAAQNALANKTSTAISAGTVLLADDQGAEPQDYVITHNESAQHTKIWVWDYAAEDGDYVQVLVNGSPTAEPFMIKHRPKEIIVPAVGDVQIKGIRDGGGGITYAVRYEINGTSYFNTAPEGEFNSYTLIKN